MKRKKLEINTKQTFENNLKKLRLPKTDFSAVK